MWIIIKTNPNPTYTVPITNISLMGFLREDCLGRVRRGLLIGSLGLATGVFVIFAGSL